MANHVGGGRTAPTPTVVKGKLNIGGLAQAAPSKSKGKAHPVLPVSAESLALLEQFLEIEPKFKELEKQSKSLKAQIAPSIKADYFRHFAGSVAPDQTQIALVGKKKEPVRLQFGTRYTSTLQDIRPLIMAVGERLAGELFGDSTLLTFDMDKMPEDKQQPFIDGVIALATKLGISQGITAKQYVKPLPGFHESRLRVLTPEQNVAVDAVLPFTAFPKLEVVR
jgi:hypothetical protein